MIKLHRVLTGGIAISYKLKSLIMTTDTGWLKYPTKFYSPKTNCEIKIYNLGLFILVFTNKRV